MVITLARTDDPILFRVGACARCGGDHEDVVFKAFDRPVIVDGTPRYHRWGTCPASHDPILMTLTEAPLGSCWMRCCGRWEEDENAVNWSTLQGGGYLHWRCRP